MQTIRAGARHGRAIHATAELLQRLRIEAMYVGAVARAAWLGGVVDSGSLDVIALMTHEQKNQLATMASNRGYRVDRGEVEQSEELDLVPLNFVDPDGEVRVHVLLATNALYGRMVAASTEANFEERTLRIPTREDLSILLAVDENASAQRDLRKLIASTEFDRREYNRKLVSIGLAELVVPQ